MYQYDDPTTVSAMPAPAAPGAPGYFTDGNAATGLPATILRSDFMNMLMEELLNVVMAAGEAPSKTTYNQVVTAIEKLIQVNPGGYAIDTGVANAYAATFSQTVEAPTDGMMRAVKITHANNGPSTFELDGSNTPYPIYGLAQLPLQGGELVPGIAVLRFNESLNAGGATPGAWVLIYCTGGALQVATATQPAHAAQAGQVQGGVLTSAVAGGAANALTATLPLGGSGLSNNQRITLTATAANSGAAALVLTLGSTVLPSYPIVKGDNQPLAPGDIPGSGYPIDLDWSVAFGAYVMQNPATGIAPSAFQSLSVSVAANALTGTLNAPTTLSFRNPALTSGVPVSALIPSPLSLTVPSGATLGTANGVSSRLIWLVAYNGGNPVLCVVNLSGGLNLDETTLITPTTISATAIAANVIYSESAVSPNSPFRVVGFCDIMEAAAGTWTTGPTTVQGIGGEAGVGIVALPRSAISNFMAYQSVSQTVNAPVTAIVEFQSKAFDDLSEFNTGTYAFTPKRAGTYVFSAGQHGGAGQSNRLLELWVNGAIRVRLQETFAAPVTPTCGFTVAGNSGPVELNAGDTVNIYVTYQGSTTDTMVIGQAYTYFGGWRIK